MSEICAVDAVLVPHSDAAYLVTFIDYLIRLGKRDGATPSEGLVRIRNALATATRITARADTSTRGVAAQPVLTLSPDGLIDTAEAAQMLGIEPDTVRWHLRKGHLKGQKKGRQLMITAASVEKFKARRAETGRSA